jgi:hypothetical protein
MVLILATGNSSRQNHDNITSQITIILPFTDPPFIDSYSRKNPPPKQIISPLDLIQKDLTRVIPGIEEALPLPWHLNGSWDM